MKSNLVVDTILKWGSLSEVQRLSALQEIENFNAKLQRREARRVVICPSLPNDTEALYVYAQPSFIFIRKIRGASASLITSVFHEGYHAMFDDYFHNKSDIVALAPIDRRRLMHEKALQDIIYQISTELKQPTLPDLCYYEEELAHREESLFLLYSILSACENEQDCEKLFESYQQSYIRYIAYLEAVGKVQRQMRYDQLISYAEEYNKQTNGERLRNTTTRRAIISVSDGKKLGEFFDRNVQLFIQLSKMDQNPVLVKMFVCNYVVNGTKLKPSWTI